MDSGVSVAWTGLASMRARLGVHRLPSSCAVETPQKLTASRRLLHLNTASGCVPTRKSAPPESQHPRASRWFLLAELMHRRCDRQRTGLLPADHEASARLSFLHSRRQSYALGMCERFMDPGAERGSAVAFSPRCGPIERWLLYIEAVVFLTIMAWRAMA
jgi:hypothetical protein